MTLTQDYLGGIELKNNAVEAVYHEEGRAYNTGSGYRYEYVLRDHLGNTRLVFTDKDGNGGIDNSEILSEAHYYPFGRKLDGAWYSDTTFSRYPYLYNGKELQAEFDLNFYDYGARWYDPGLGSWWEIDPLAEVSRRWSPYVFSNNNPLRFVDPDGMLPGDSYDQWTQAKNTEAAAADQQGLGAFSALDGGGGDPPAKKASSATPKTGQNNTTFEEQTKDLGSDLVANLVAIGKALLDIKDQDPNGPIQAMMPMPFFMGGGSSGVKIATLVEANAARRLVAMEAATKGAHFVSRHGAGTTLVQQEVRALTGLTPDGVQKGIQDASRFFSNQVQLQSIQRAQTIFNQTGRNVINFNMGLTVGEGYLRGGSAVIQSSDVRAIFSGRQLITIFPVVRP